MSKILNSAILRATLFILLGIAIIAFSENIAEWLIRVIGIAFIIPGLIAIASFFEAQKHGEPSSLNVVSGAGCCAFGGVLLASPDLFLTAIVYVLGGVLVVVAAAQFFRLWSLNRSGVKSPAILNVIPLFHLVVGLWLLLIEDKACIPALPIILTGAAFILYGLLDLWSQHLISGTKKAEGFILAGQSASEENGSAEQIVAIEANERPETQSEA